MKLCIRGVSHIDKPKFVQTFYQQSCPTASGMRYIHTSLRSSRKMRP
jgi:hypothetical protein